MQTDPAAKDQPVTLLLAEEVQLVLPAGRRRATARGVLTTPHCGQSVQLRTTLTGLEEGLRDGWLVSPGAGSVHCTACAALLLVGQYQRSTPSTPFAVSRLDGLKYTSLSLHRSNSRSGRSKMRAHQTVHIDTHIKLSGRVAHRPPPVTLVTMQ